MGKRIERIKFFKEVEEEVTTLCKCDACGRTIREAIPEEENGKKIFKIKVPPDMKGETCWSIRAVHCQWGNDSIESAVTFQACSYTCANKIVFDLMQTNDYGKSGTFNIEACSAEEV